MMEFIGQIRIIGVNPYILLPDDVLLKVFEQGRKDRGAIPVRARLNGEEFTQTLVKYSGMWRLYLNTPIRKSTRTDVGDMVTVEIEFDPVERIFEMHPKLMKALENEAQAKVVYDKLSPSRQNEIVRYINFLKSEDSIDKNVKRVILFLLGKERFAGRDKP